MRRHYGHMNTSPRAREEKSPGLKAKTSIGFVRDIFSLRQ
jgi:hypothetical protein